ncbi:MAG: DUF6273 domain-containing protein [Acutalibacteraceae bacterium]
MTRKSKKAVSAAAALLTAAAMLLTGTFAWQSISQTALNERDGEGNPGGRLHDDFNGKNKDIYVENFTDPEDENSMPIFARVRLDEYMETGIGAGKHDDPDFDIANITVITTGADFNDKSTWLTHIPGHIEDTVINQAHTALHDYWEWEMGGQTVYMPTFNKVNKVSGSEEQSIIDMLLAADINGTYEGTDGDRTAGTKYDDYVEYEVGDEKTDIAYYKDSINKEETHIAKETQNATVITMKEWLQLPTESQIGNYWVYDVDGWAYWAKSIEPGETTGLLLNGIELKRQPDTEWYYAINAVGQFATAGDWGDKTEGTGFYKDGITDNALYLLNRAADILPDITYMQVGGGDVQYVRAGDTLTLTANIDVKNAAGNTSETYAIWSSDPSTTTLQGNTFKPTNSMVGKKYVLTATSVYDTTKTAETTVYVIPKDSTGNVVEGAMDGKMYVQFSDNTYKEINLEDGSIGEFVSAGANQTIGDNDDRTDVVMYNDIEGITDLQFGTKLIGPDDDGIYLAMGDDNLLGTDDDIKVTKDPREGREQYLTKILANGITITVDGNATTVKIQKKLQFNAVVTLYGSEISNQDIIWTVSGNSDTNTTIDANGLLTVGENETTEKNLVITATSKQSPDVQSKYQVTVKPWDFDNLEEMPIGTTKTVTIDGVQWYVLAKENGRALIWSKNIVGNLQAFTSSGSDTAPWSSSSARATLKTWLSNTTVLKDKAIETDITTRDPGNTSAWITTSDKVFMLSEADVFGTFSGSATTNSKDYTYGNQKLVTDSDMIKSNQSYWLRSGYGNKIAAVTSSGARGDNYYYMPNTYGFRPALWVDLT